MDDVIFTQNKDLLNSLINENQQMGIIIGEPHDLDKVAAGLSLYLSLKGIGRDVQIVSKREPIVEYSNLFGINKIKKDFSGGIKTLTVTFPYIEGEIEKVSYNIEGDKLNVNLFSGEKQISFSESDIKYIKKGSAPSVIFAIGVSGVDSLMGFVEPDQNTKIVNIDNSQRNSSFGDVVYVSPTFSSISEVIAKIIKDLALYMDQDAAQNLMDGLSFKTNNFVSVTTSPIAFEAASYLLKNGARRKILEKKREDLEKPYVADTNIRPNFRKAPQFGNEPKSANRDNMANKDNQPQVQQVQQVQQNPENLEYNKIPKDWLKPKVFKGSADEDDKQ